MRIGACAGQNCGREGNCRGEGGGQDSPKGAIAIAPRLQGPAGYKTGLRCRPHQPTAEGPGGDFFALESLVIEARRRSRSSGVNSIRLRMPRMSRIASACSDVGS